jgi:hypothetical protein
MLRRPATCVAFVSILSLSAPALAGNEPEKAQQRAEQDLLPKLVAACGVPLSLSYDGESLRKNNKDISGDQTDGENQCNEPAVIWYACDRPGKAAIKAARILGGAKVPGQRRVPQRVGGDRHCRTRVRGEPAVRAQPQAVRGRRSRAPRARS